MVGWIILFGILVFLWLALVEPAPPKVQCCLHGRDVKTCKRMNRRSLRDRRPRFRKEFDRIL